MQYLLKVSPKGQVILPKKVREKLKIKDLISIEIDDSEGRVKKPDLSTDKLAGCFSKYASRRKISAKKAVEKATAMVADEVAGKNT